MATQSFDIIELYNIVCDKGETTMKFAELLYQYEVSLQHLKRYKDKEAANDIHYYLHSLFNRLKMICDDFDPTIRYVKSDESKRFEYSETINGETIDWPIYGILEYRGKTIPVYLDDCGQSLFARYDNHTFGGGTYNMHPEFDFCYWIDYNIDDEILREDAE